MMDRTEHALFARMEADLVVLTQLAGQDLLTITAQEREIAFLRATLDYIGDLLSSNECDAAGRALVIIRATLGQGDHHV